MKSRIFSRLVLLVAVAVAAASLISTGARFILPADPAARRRTRRCRRARPPTWASTSAGSPPGYQPVAEFARRLPPGKQPNLVGYYSGWAEPFQTSFAERVHAHGAIPYVQIDPTDASVSGDRHRGVYDLYLRTYADSVRDFGHAVVIGFGHEMNAPRYSWGYGHVRPAVFVAAWRHIVTLFHGEGADNVTWLWTVNQDAPGTGPVSGLVAGRQATSPGSASTATTTVRPIRSPTSSADTITQVRIFTDKPILLSETAVGPSPPPVRQDQQPVPRDAPVQDARAGVVRHRPERRDPPSGLARRAQLVGRDGLPARHLGADAGAALPVARPAPAAGPRPLYRPRHSEAAQVRAQLIAAAGAETRGPQRPAGRSG